MSVLNFYAHNAHNIFRIDSNDVLSGITAREGLVVGAFSGQQCGRYRLTTSFNRGSIGTNPGWSDEADSWELEAIASNAQYTLFSSGEGEFFMFREKDSSSVGRWFFAELVALHEPTSKDVILKTAQEGRRLPAEQAFEVMNDLKQHGLRAHVDFIVFFPEAREEALSLLRRHFRQTERRIRTLRGYGRQDVVEEELLEKRRLRKLRNSF